MKVVRLHAAGDLRLHEELAPIARPGETLIRPLAVGVCGSDLHWFHESGIGDARLEQALVLGHEFAALSDSDQLVAVDPAIPCRTCTWCLQGHPNLCPHILFAGHGKVDGALRQQMVWDSRCLFPLPESLSAADGAMLEPLGVALQAVDLSHLKPGMAVTVFGCGPIGLLIIQVARLSGASKIIASDLLPHRLDAARDYGAQHTFLVDGRLDEHAIQALTARQGVDIAFEAAGSQDAVDDAFAAVSPGGKVILAGIPDSDQTSFSASLARRKGLTIKMVRRMKHTYPRAIALVAQGLVDVRSLVTHRFPLEQASQAFALAARREGIKTLIEI